MAAALLLLPGCSDIKNVLSFPRVSPDEFTVVAGKPLLLPSDFTLHPPGSETADVEANRAKEVAQEALFSGASTSNSSELTSGEAALLEQLGSSQALQNIANSPDGEADQAVVVDPEAEAERLRANKEAGVAPTEGATPTRPEPGKSIFDRVRDFF